MTLAQAIENKYNRGIAECSNEEIYYCLLEMTKKMAEDKISNDGKKKLYYISAEFLIGKLLSNNLINLGIYEDIKKELADNGKAIGDIEEMEEIGYDDYFFGKGICLIEWAELIEEILPDDRISITIEKNLEQGFDYRRITVEGL